MLRVALTAACMLLAGASAQGIGAAESAQTCTDGRPASRLATETLNTMLAAAKSVECKGETNDRYGGRVAVCVADGVDVSAELVRTGIALAFTRYSVVYVDQEAEAKAANSGVEPWDYRARDKVAK